ncbi:MAG: DNA polymerase I [Fimbriimonadaceae bacterium]|nr:DNA polymerase I [Fimbriimonadaceae bacterium]
MPPSRRLVIIDGFSLLFRAFYGTRYLSTSDGRPTNALFGFFGMVFTLLEQVKPDAILVAHDAPGKTFRHAEYAEYKGTRRETPSELEQQLDGSEAFIQALKIPVISVTGYEADDIVGTISRLAEENGYLTTIVTGDLDSLQLVDECVQVMTTRRGVTDTVIYDPAAVVERYGFGPEHITDYKALVGDTSDNIKGVPGIGDKTATLLIQEFGGIEEIISRMEEIPEKFRKKLVGQEEQMRHSKWLATIVRDVPLQYDFAPFAVDAESLAIADEMMQSLEFRSYRKKLPEVFAPYRTDGAATVAAVKEEPVQATSEVSLGTIDSIRKWLGDSNYAVLPGPPATPTNLLDENTESAHGFIAKGTDVAKAPWEHILSVFADDPSRATGHDIKSLFHSCRSSVVPRFDTMLGGYVLQSGRTSYDLGDLIAGYLDTSPPSRPEDRVAALAALEATMRERLKAENQTSVLEEIELPLVPVLADMECTGIKLDPGYLKEYSNNLQIEIEAVQKQVWDAAGEEFNIGSPKQIGEVLFDRMQMPGGKKTKTGWATGAEILEELAAEHPVAAGILTYRELTKLKGTYADALPRMLADDGRIHTKFNQAVAATGRLSSNEPNLQNIPIRTELGRRIRRAFVAAPGYQLLSFDYSQIELRILAHMCQDEALTDAFRDRVDVHRVTAAQMFDTSPDEVTREQRGLAKMLNYAVLYGVTDFGLAQQLGAGFSVSEAKELIRKYNERFPQVKGFTDSVVEEARSKGFTSTLCGRRRYFPDIHAGNRVARMYAERQAMNAPIQGTAADLVKIAMLQVEKLIANTGVRMLLQVHDELVFEVPEDKESPLEEIRNLMEKAIPMSVPIEVDGKMGPNWLDMTPISMERG